MSNGLTSVFIETMCLAGSEIAQENYQKDLMIWFGQHDWVIMGMGTEGFDISEIIWDGEKFDEQRQFMLDVIHRAQEKTNWNLLGYEPNEKMTISTLSDFKDMVSSFTINHVEENETEDIFEFDGEINKYDKCSKHNIYKHYQGCVICNNEPIESTK